MSWTPYQAFQISRGPGSFFKIITTEKHNLKSKLLRQWGYTPTDAQHSKAG